MFMASRAQLHEEVILPALLRKDVIVMDRWAWSTFAYQTVIGDIKMSDIESLTNFTVGNHWPHLTIILDIDPKKALKRIADKKADAFEGRGVGFFEKVRANYLHLRDIYPTVEVINGDRPQEEVAADIWRLYKERS